MAKESAFMDYIKIFGAFILIILLAFSFGVRFGGSFDTKDGSQTSENIVYQNQTSETILIRYKYELGYESLDDFEDIGEPVYSLLINDDVIEAFTPTNLPIVSKVEKVHKGKSTKKKFDVKLSDKVDKDKIRIDVKIVIEELKGGKWSPVYQAIFMERGPYWSLDKGPIEFIKED